MSAKGGVDDVVDNLSFHVLLLLTLVHDVALRVVVELVGDDGKVGVHPSALALPLEVRLADDVPPDVPDHLLVLAHQHRQQALLGEEVAHPVHAVVAVGVGVAEQVHRLRRGNGPLREGPEDGVVDEGHLLGVPGGEVRHGEGGRLGAHLRGAVDVVLALRLEEPQAFGAVVGDRADVDRLEAAGHHLVAEVLRVLLLVGLV